MFDTNVIVSAVLLPKLKPRKAFDLATQSATILVSDEVVEELNDVLRRADFEKYVTEALRMEFLAALLRDAELVDITEHVKECRDPRDDRLHSARMQAMRLVPCHLLLLCLPVRLGSGSSAVGQRLDELCNSPRERTCLSSLINIHLFRPSEYFIRDLKMLQTIRG